MSSRTPPRVQTPILRNKDPPRNGRTNHDRTQGRNVTWQSYASVAARNLVSPSKIVRSQDERESTPNSTESASWTPQESHYRPLKRGSTEHSVIFDVTGNVTSPKLFYKALSEILTEDQHLGAKFSKENGRSLIEIACDSDATCDMLIVSGVVVQENTLTPTKALAQDAEIVTLLLSDLPFVRKLDLQQHLYGILGKYGKVLDVLLFTDPDSGFFFGNGMAILNRTTPQEIRQATDYDPDVQYYASLTHNIDYHGKQRFHAKWRNMPPHCVYCHSEEHIITACEERPQLRCWNCNAIGHVRAKCPLKNVVKNRKKPKQHHRADNFSESEDEAFEDNLAQLGEKAEKEYQYRQQENDQGQQENDQGQQDITDLTRSNGDKEGDQNEDEILSTSALSDLEEKEDEDTIMEEQTVTENIGGQEIQKENDVPMDGVNNSSVDNTSQSSKTTKTKEKQEGAPKTPKPAPQETASRYPFRHKRRDASDGSVRPSTPPHQQ